MQIIINLLVNLFFNFTETFILMGYIFVFAKINMKNNMTKNTIIFIFLTISSYYIQHLSNTNYSAIIGVVLYIVVFTLFYAIKFRKTIKYVLSSFVTMLLFEFTVVLPYIMFFGGKMEDLRNNPVLKFGGSLVTRSIAILVLVILYKRRCLINENR